MIDVVVVHDRGEVRGRHRHHVVEQTTQLSHRTRPRSPRPCLGILSALGNNATVKLPCCPRLHLARKASEQLLNLRLLENEFDVTRRAAALVSAEVAQGEAVLVDEGVEAALEPFLLEALGDAPDAGRPVLVEHGDEEHEAHRVRREVADAGPRVAILTVEAVVRRAQIAREQDHLDDECGVLLVHALEHLGERRLDFDVLVLVKFAKVEVRHPVAQPCRLSTTEVGGSTGGDVGPIICGLGTATSCLRRRRFMLSCPFVIGSQPRRCNRFGFPCNKPTQCFGVGLLDDPHVLCQLLEL